MSADVTGISVESGISSDARVCSACRLDRERVQRLADEPPPLTAQWPVVPLTFGPVMNSGFDGIVAEPVYRPIFGLTSCLRATGKLDSPVTGVSALLRPAPRG